jgi:hypothetical protein
MATAKQGFMPDRAPSRKAILIVRTALRRIMPAQSDRRRRRWRQISIDEKKGS